MATFNGTDGDDTYTGGPDNDTIYGNGGNDTLSGGAGDDKIYGGSGTNTLSGGDGSDVIYSQGGVDTVDGGTVSGNSVDTWVGDYSADTAGLTFNESSGTLSNGTSIKDVAVVKLTTGSGNDSITLSSLSDGSTFDAGAGSDSLIWDISQTYSDFLTFSITGSNGSLRVESIDSYPNYDPSIVQFQMSTL